MPRPLPWIFPYEEELRVEGNHFLRKPFLRPIVVVRLAGVRMGDHNLAALVDSGCDHIVAAPWVAQDIGVTPDPNREIGVRIGGAPRRVRFADVSIRLLPPAIDGGDGDLDLSQALEWQAQVGFFTEWLAPPWNVVLGQVGFFDQFTVIFNREAQALAVSSLDEFDIGFRNLPLRRARRPLDSIPSWAITPRSAPPPPTHQPQPQPRCPRQPHRETVAVMGHDGWVTEPLGRGPTWGIRWPRPTSGCRRPFDAGPAPAC